MMFEWISSVCKLLYFNAVKIVWSTKLDAIYKLFRSKEWKQNEWKKEGKKEKPIEWSHFSLQHKCLYLHNQFVCKYLTWKKLGQLRFVLFFCASSYSQNRIRWLFSIDIRKMRINSAFCFVLPFVGGFFLWIFAFAPFRASFSREKKRYCRVEVMHYIIIIIIIIAILHVCAYIFAYTVF